jgi:5-methylcytosine-specific restriction endonuclease McrA
VRLPGYFWNHPKIVAAGNENAGWYVRLLSCAGMYSRSNTVHPVHVRLFFPERVLEDLARHDLIVLRRDGSVAVRSLQRPGSTHRQNAEGNATRAQVAARVEFYGGKCWICRTAPGTTIDHVKPLRAGGTNWPANLRPACPSCNSRKGSRWPFEVAA